MKRVLIVGGGIAGPVLAMFLRRLGTDALIAEARASASETEGAFLGVAPNGMNVLAELGLDRAVRERGAASHGFAFLNARGARIGTIDQTNDERDYGAPMVIVRRAVLHAVLLEGAQRAGAQVKFGARLTSLDCSNPKEVVARFEDGRVERADFVVGCDGIRSRTRALVMPDAPAPDYLQQLDFGGYARVADVDCDVPLEVGWNVMTFGKRAFFGAFRRPDGEIWWFHNSGEPEAVRELDPETRRARILELHKNDPQWIGAIVRATPEIAGPWPLHDILSIPSWHRGRVALIGDAAHATSPSAGQGASLAMEDAMMLAICLREHGEPEAAFAAMEKARRARVEAIVKQSRRNGSSKVPGNALSAWMRDRLLPFFLKQGSEATKEHYSYRIEWAGAAE